MAAELPVPATLASRETTALQRWATVAGIGLILLIIAADSYEAWADYRRVIRDNERLQVALARALTEQTARMVQEADVVLSDYAAWMEARGGAAADQQTQTARLKRTLVSMPFIASAALIGADGQLLASVPSVVGEPRDFRERDIFKIPQAADADVLFVDRPQIRTDQGPRSFALSRRFMAPTGSFGGIVVARVSFDYLGKFYSGVSVTPQTTIRLLRRDGVVLAQYPASPVEMPVTHPRLPGEHVDPSAQDTERAGRVYIEVEQNVNGYPIVVEVSRSLASVLQPWIQEERSSAARTLSLALLAAVLLWTLRSALSRQVHAESERRRLEQELAAVQRVEALGSLAAAVAHDFNNVLTAIIGYAELSRDMATADPKMHSNLERLLAATERARLLVSRVLTFDPHRSLSYRPTAVEPIVVEVSHQIEATLPANITMDVRIATHDGKLAGDAQVAGDATEIYQVLMNLCSNAVHAMPAGGTLCIGLQLVDLTVPEKFAVGSVLPGRWVCVSVADSGMGLADDQRSSIFEPFYTTRQLGTGTGIGLTVVRNIISRMQGALKVDSAVGVGTCMTVYWPAAPAPGLDQTAAAASETGHASTPGAGETILVIDDERELVALTEELLASLSYEPVGFSDARAALEAFRHDPRRFDAILTDERMQAMRGLELARQIRAIDPRVPVLLMTGHRDAEIDAQAVKAGIVEIIDKPLRVHTLSDALARQLRARKP